MTELERMKHHGTVKAIAEKLNIEFKEVEVHSLKCIHVREPSNGEWILFDPINRGKDFAKVLFLSAKRQGEATCETTFRKEIMELVVNHDFPI